MTRGITAKTRPATSAPDMMATLYMETVVPSITDVVSKNTLNQGGGGCRSLGHKRNDQTAAYSCLPHPVAAALHVNGEQAG